MLEMCSHGGVANEYCKLFAAREEQPENDVVTITNQSLVKMTKEELKEIEKAAKYGLAEHIADTSVWVYNEESTEGEENGYKVCEDHTLESWEEYLSGLLPDPTDPEPTDPEIHFPPAA